MARKTKKRGAQRATADEAKGAGRAAKQAKPAKKATPPAKRVPASKNAGKAPAKLGGAKRTIGSSARVDREADTSPVRVLFIDDEADRLERTVGAGLPATVRATFRAPNHVTGTELGASDVAMVDYNLVHWHEAQTGVGLVASTTAGVLSGLPRNGLVVISSLRALAEDHPATATACALFTGEAMQLPGFSMAANHRHLLARSLGVEWIFQKNETEFLPQVVSLGRAARALPATPPTTVRAASEELLRLLAMPAQAWAVDAEEQILASAPPLVTAASATQGLGLLRWLLHQILPYPTFLMDARHLAARLRVTPASLAAALNADSALVQALAPARFTGALAEFAGPRWWRAGVNDIVWRLTAGNPHRSELETQLTHLSAQLQFSSARQPVAALNADLEVTDEQVDVTEAVEVRPEGWPAFADPAWLPTRILTEAPDLASAVVARDRGRSSSVS